MLWLLFGPLIFAIGYKRFEVDNWILAVLGFLFSMVAGVIPAMIICSIISTRLDYKVVENIRYPLVAIHQGDTGSSGTFFLGSGSIHSDPTYFWYRRQGDAIVGGSTPRVTGVRIYEDDQPPCMVTYHAVYVSEWVQENIWWFAIDNMSNYTYWPEFHIPPGSVREGFGL